MAKIKYKLNPSPLGKSKPPTVRVKPQWSASSKLTFGKYKNKTIRTVMALNPEYLIWASNNIEWFKLPAKLLADINELVVPKQNYYGSDNMDDMDERDPDDIDEDKDDWCPGMDQVY